MIRQNELMNVRCSERGSLLGIKIYSPSSECLIECVDIPEQFYYMATIYNSSFHCNRIQIYETRLNFIVSTAFKIYRRSVLGTCSTWCSVAEDSAGNLPLSATTES